MNSTLLDLSNGFANAVAGQSVVSVNEGGRAGVSGTIWRDDLVVTAEHTIRDQQELTIELPGDKTSTATVVGRDPTIDIALLRLKDTAPAATDFIDAQQIRVGHFVLAIGRRGKDGLVASHGIVSALCGAWRTWRGGRIDQWFRLDLMPFTGFSDGPLVNAEGKVIGVNTSGPRRSVMTIPTATVNRVVDLLLTKGRIARGFLGVALQPVPLSASFAGQGLLVIMVDPQGPAENALCEWMTAAEAAAYLRTKPRTLLKWVREGSIKAWPLHGGKRRTWRFRKEDLDAALGFAAARTSDSVLSSKSSFVALQ